MPRFSLEVHDYVGDVNKVTETESRGISHLKKDRGARRKFSKEPLRGFKILFLGRGLKITFNPNSHRF